MIDKYGKFVDEPVNFPFSIKKKNSKFYAKFH